MFFKKLILAKKYIFAKFDIYRCKNQDFETLILRIFIKFCDIKLFEITATFTTDNTYVFWNKMKIQIDNENAQRI